MGSFRVELVDEPAEYVGPLLEGYRRALDAAIASGGRQPRRQQPREHGRRGEEEELWDWLQGLPDANGRAQGCGLGSLEVRAERKVGSMKQTAASLR